MKKLIFLLTSILTAAAFICAVFIIGVFASPSIVYLDAENGSDSNDGTSPDRAFATMEKAIEMLSEELSFYAQTILLTLTAFLSSLSTTVR